MRVRVLIFGMLRDLFAERDWELELPEGARASAVLEHLRAQQPGKLWDAVAIAVNGRYAKPGATLHDGDEVALLPPVSGGSAGGERASLVRAPIDREATVRSCAAGEDGAVVIFDGVVRNNTRGRQTLFLDYQGYEAMAVDQMRGLLAEAKERFAVREAAVVHRLGRLEIGESSVLIVVAAAHRAAAFDACRWIIDTLKTTVPIWKKEHFVDGAVWADGEPFPEQIRPAGTSA